MRSPKLSKTSYNTLLDHMNSDWIASAPCIDYALLSHLQSAASFNVFSNVYQDRPVRRLSSTVLFRSAYGQYLPNKVRVVVVSSNFKRQRIDHESKAERTR